MRKILVTFLIVVSVLVGVSLAQDDDSNLQEITTSLSKISTLNDAWSQAQANLQSAHAAEDAAFATYQAAIVEAELAAVNEQQAWQSLIAEGRVFAELIGILQPPVVEPIQSPQAQQPVQQQTQPTEQPTEQATQSQPVQQPTEQETQSQPAQQPVQQATATPSS